MLPSELLRAKRYKKNFTTEEITFFVQGIVDSTIADAQIGAFLMALCTVGMSLEETTALTLAMASTGEQYSFPNSKVPRIDKHSTGGIGDKLSLLLVPIISSLDIAVPMMSGRGLGHTGGTVDKLESIVDLSMDFTIDELRALLDSQNGFMTKQTPTIAPADRILYSLRDITGTVESLGLITASILSKKMSEDLHGLVLDMKVGQGAFMQTLAAAQELGRSMLSVAAGASLPMRIVFSSMDEPIGHAVGNWVEVRETEQCLKDFNSTPNEIKELTLQLGANMLELGYRHQGGEISRNQAIEMIILCWKNGRAHAKFFELIAAQGGDWSSTCEKYSNQQSLPVYAHSNGEVMSIDSRQIGVKIIELGGGRRIQSDAIDHSVGIIIHKKVGDIVTKADVICTIEAQQLPTCVHSQEFILALQECWNIQPHITRTNIESDISSTKKKSIIIDEWTNV